MGECSPTKWFYIGGRDERVYGPFTSEEMLEWWRCQYFKGFEDSLRLRTENDLRFYTLSEWIAACGNKIPFILQLHSMESLQMNGTMGNLNFTGPQQQSLEGTIQFGSSYPLSVPVSGSNPPLFRHVGSVEQKYQRIEGVPSSGGMPIQLLPAAPQRPLSAQQLLLTNHSPLVIPVSSVPALPAYQIIQQPQTLPPPVAHSQQSFVPIRFPPPFIPNQQLHQQMTNLSFAEQHQQDGGGSAFVSDSPDSGHVVTPSSYPMQQRMNGGVEHTIQERENDIAAIQLVDAWTNTEEDTQNKHTAETQTEDLKISQLEAERLLSQLLGIRVRITLPKTE